MKSPPADCSFEIPLLLLVLNGFIVCPFDCQELTVPMNLPLDTQISSLFYLHALAFILDKFKMPDLQKQGTFNPL